MSAFGTAVVTAWFRPAVVTACLITVEGLQDGDVLAFAGGDGISHLL